MTDAEHSPDTRGGIAPGTASRAPRTEHGTRLAVNELRRVVTSNTDRILHRLNQIETRIYFNELTQRSGESLMRVFGSISLTLLPLLAAIFSLRCLPDRMDDLSLIVSTFAILTSLLIGICIGLPILIANVHDYFSAQSYVTQSRHNRWFRRHLLEEQELSSTPGGGGDQHNTDDDDD